MAAIIKPEELARRAAEAAAAEAARLAAEAAEAAGEPAPPQIYHAPPPIKYHQPVEPAPPQEEQAAPPVIYTVDPMERPGWVDPDLPFAPTEQDITGHLTNLRTNYPNLSGQEYERMKADIRDIRAERKAEAAKTPQEKYEEYKTETLVPYLTETVGLMGTIGPEMKPPEKVEDYYSWQEESLDPWSSKVRKKEGEISQKKYETYKGETLIPYLRETGATIRPPGEVSAFQKWEETTFSPWSKDYETTQTAAQIKAQEEEYTKWRQEIFPELQASGFLPPGFAGGPASAEYKARAPPIKYEDYGKWETDIYSTWVAGEEQKAQTEYETYLPGIEETVSQLKEHDIYKNISFDIPTSYKDYGKWDETFLSPALKQAEEIKFQEFVTSPKLARIAKREGKTEFFAENPEVYAKRIQKRLDEEARRANVDARELEKKLTYGYTATGKLRSGFAPLAMSDYIYGQKQKEHTKFMEE